MELSAWNYSDSIFWYQVEYVSNILIWILGTFSKTQVPLSNSEQEKAHEDIVETAR